MVHNVCDFAPPRHGFRRRELCVALAFAERLRDILITSDRAAFKEMHMNYRYWSEEAAGSPDYLNDIFGENSAGLSIPKFLSASGVFISVYEYGYHEFEDSGCPSWKKLVIFYSKLPIGRILDLYLKKSKKLFDMWKRDFVETHVYRCGDIYRFGGTAFHSHSHVPWVGDYG